MSRMRRSSTQRGGCNISSLILLTVKQLIRTKVITICFYFLQWICHVDIRCGLLNKNNNLISMLCMIETGLEMETEFVCSISGGKDMRRRESAKSVTHDGKE